MKIISDREFRNNPGKIRRELDSQEVIMTSRGKPYALLLPLDNPENLEEILEMAARLKAQMALSSVRKKAAAAGLDQLPASEIDEEIKAVRSKRRKNP